MPQRLRCLRHFEARHLCCSGHHWRVRSLRWHGRSHQRSLRNGNCPREFLDGGRTGGIYRTNFPRINDGSSAFRLSCASGVNLFSCDSCPRCLLDFTHGPRIDHYCYTPRTPRVGDALRCCITCISWIEAPQVISKFSTLLPLHPSQRNNRT